MTKVLLLQFEADPECATRRDALASLGLTIVEAEPRWPDFFDTIAAQRPDVIVISCGMLPQHGREAARYIGDGFNTRNVPVILVDVAQPDLAATKASAPRATIVERAALAASVKAKSLV